MSNTELLLVALIMIFSVPYLIWRIGRTDYYAPLVVVQILTGVLLGPGIFGALVPDYYDFVFNAEVVHSLTGVATWAVMIFVFIAGVELDLKKAWEHKNESGITAGLALGMPMAFGCMAGLALLPFGGWLGAGGSSWQFVAGVGMSCAVTALPILILLMEKLAILRQPIGQRILRYASLDDIAIWGVLAFILLDWDRAERQGLFLVMFPLTAWLYCRLMNAIAERDRWYVMLAWLPACGLAADWAGLHYMVGAFVAGAVTDGKWFNQENMDRLRHHVLLVIMPVFFLSTGLRTNWEVGGTAVFAAAAVLLVASVAGKLAGVHLAGWILKWRRGEASVVGWLLQTKALIMIIFANVLLDRGIITNEAFTALLLMAVASTMLAVPMTAPLLAKLNAADEPVLSRRR